MPLSLYSLSSYYSEEKLLGIKKKIMEGDFRNKFLVWEFVYDTAVSMLLL